MGFGLGGCWEHRGFHCKNDGNSLRHDGGKGDLSLGFGLGGCWEHRGFHCKTMGTHCDTMEVMEACLWGLGWGAAGSIVGFIAKRWELIATR